MPNTRTSGRKPDGFAGGKVEGAVSIQQSVEGEEGFGPGGIQLGEVEQGRPAQRPGDVAVLPPALGSALAIAVKTGRSDQGHVAHLPGERDPVVGQAEPGRELLDVMVLAGAHVAPHRQMKRREPFRVGAPNRLDLGKAVEHPEIDVVRIGLGDLADSLWVVGHALVDLELLERDRWSRSAWGLRKSTCLRH